MNSDRELLERAAKAAGYADAEYQHGGDWMQIRYGFDEAVFSERLHDECGNGYWNSLTDDGDALRLAVKRNVLQCHMHLFWMFYNKEIESGYDNDAATRRAIVRAAAALSPAAIREPDAGGGA